MRVGRKVAGGEEGWTWGDSSREGCKLGGRLPRGREAAGGEGMQVDGGASNPGDRMYEGVRSIFYYNTEVQPGQSVGLHLFEPRYRVLVKRAVEEPARNRELIFLP